MPATFSCWGHENIRATHTKTMEFTKDRSITPRATCVVGVGADWDDRTMLELRGPVLLVLEADGHRQEIRGHLSASPWLHSLIVRRGPDLADRTFIHSADTAAAGLDRDLVRAMQDPATRMSVTLTRDQGELAGTLFVVSLPIGNYDDLSPRARRTITQADVVLAEDTRRFRTLARDANITYRRVERFDAHAEAERVEAVLDMLGSGLRLALVTDAGTPAISDPGTSLIRAAGANGFPIRPVPGASALLAATMCAGIASNQLLFLGFLPRRATRRQRALLEASIPDTTIVLFEAPSRLRSTLMDLRDVLPGRELVITRELTKMHEEIVRTTTSEALDALSDEPRGEYTLVVGPPVVEPPNPEIATETVGRDAALRVIAELRGSVPASDLATALSKAVGISRRAAYDIVVAMPKPEVM